MGHDRSCLFALKPVAYQPGDPDDARIDSFWTLWFPPGLMALFGLLCLIAGGHTLRQSRFQ